MDHQGTGNEAMSRVGTSVVVFTGSATGTLAVRSGQVGDGAGAHDGGEAF